MSRRAALLALTISALGCATPERPWTFAGAARPAAWDAQLPHAVAAVRKVAPDRKAHVKAGGLVVVHDEQAPIDAVCGIKAPWHAAGCASSRRIDVLLLPARGIGPDFYRTAILHELCHLGLETGGGMWHGPVIFSDEGPTDACAASAAAVARREEAP